MSAGFVAASDGSCGLDGGVDEGETRGGRNLATFGTVLAAGLILRTPLT
jgi:hypothetical protein